MTGSTDYFEIPTQDAAAAKAFWGGMFGWRFEEGNFPNYSMIPIASPVAGLDASRGDAPIRVYFGVADINAAVHRVAELGGEAGDVVEIPAGWFALCRDDQGLSFGLWQGR